ncbi:MAG TPA: tetratricopeptide repeat protein, partial [Chthonomonadaceae bacterium]|nr:tetratricopeptide repeat protein [Chthonomonadaceae bacterium]
MKNSQILSEPNLQAGPSNEVVPSPDSIAGVTARLARWGRLAPQGLARVEYVSPPARDAALQALRKEFASSDIPFHEIELTPHTPADRHVLRLRKELGALSPCVVSITGLSHAFPLEIPLTESLDVLNRNRDTLVHFPLRQIWWMQSEMAQIFHLNNPDFDRFFLIRLHLAEIPTSHDSKTMGRKLLPEGDFLNYEEARHISLYYKERFYNALRQRLPLAQVISLAMNVLKPLRLTGHVKEAVETQLTLFMEMEKESYDMEAYLHGRSNETEQSLLDADNFYELSYQYWQQGKYAEAERYSCYEKAIRERLQGPEHPATLECMDNLAVQYHEQGRYEEAERLSIAILALRRKALPPDHRDIAISLHNLAWLYDDQGEYERAEALYLQALAIAEKVLGPEHPGTASSINNLAVLYGDVGAFKKAVSLYLRALAIDEKVLGPDHP